MSVSIKTLEDYGFLSCFLGGVITTLMAFLSLIVNLASKKDANWFLGSGYIGLASPVAGSIVSLIFGIVAILIGLALFVPKIGDIVYKINMLAIAIIMIAIGIIAFGIGGILIIIGGVLVLIDYVKTNQE